MPGTIFFTWPRPWVKRFLGPLDKPLVFIPYAAVTLPFDEYTQKVRDVFRPMGYSIDSIHDAPNKELALREAGAIVTGGGNTFALLARLYDAGLLSVIQDAVRDGTPYIGWSAGANIACPTIMTTNDMPVVQPRSFEALHIVPFQINPHYHELKFEGQGGETRPERIAEFVSLNPGQKVVGLPEGMLVESLNHTFRLGGEGVAKVYESGQKVRALKAGDEI